MIGTHASLPAMFQQGLAHHQAGRLQQAAAIYRQVLTMDPAHADSLHLLGLIFHQSGRNDLAIDHIRQAIALQPSAAFYHNNLGLALSAEDRLPEAEACYHMALRLKSDYPEAHNNLGIALQLQTRFSESENCFRTALRFNPAYPKAHNGLGNSLANLGRLDEAQACYRTALRLNPGYPEAHNNLGNVLNDLGHPDQAEGSYRVALHLRPDYAEAYGGLGIALSGLGRLDEADRCYREAVRMKPQSAELRKKLGDWLSSLGRLEEAAACYREALRLKPDFVAARVSACMAGLSLVYPDATALDTARADYAAELEKIVADCPADSPETIATIKTSGWLLPFYLAYQGSNDRDLQARFGRWVAAGMAAAYPAWTSPPEVAPPEAGERIRVGILSAYFYNHSNWKIPIKGWLTGLDRDRFEVFGYSIGTHRDAETAIAEALCQRFVGGPLRLEQWAETIRADRLHVLLIPEIGMDQTTAKLAALRLARVQATSWGHPDTSGLPTIDHFLSSELMEPADADGHYTEQLVRLPNLSIWYEPLELASERVSRADLGVSDDAILYWCCQSLHKYLPQYDWIFPRIALAVPKARFVFIGFFRDEAVTNLFRNRLAIAFEAAGLDAEQHCIVLPHMSPARFAGISRLADLFLDSIGWSGCNSTLEALAGDLPVITMAGSLMRSRHSAAILSMLGMPDLIADTPQAFVDLAVALAHDRPRRQRIAAQIARDKERLYRDPACLQGLTRYLEDAARNSFGVSR